MTNAQVASKAALIFGVSVVGVRREKPGKWTLALEDGSVAVAYWRQGRFLLAMLHDAWRD